jgi:hypothetical protein
VAPEGGGPVSQLSKCSNRCLDVDFGEKRLLDRTGETQAPGRVTSYRT